MFLLIAIIFSVYAKTKVFVILHSHNDAGWLNTVDDYYYNYTQHVISNMITFLQEYPSLRFSWAETMFLSKYLESHKSEIPIVKKLIESKRLEIVGGGWVQNDEALPDFELAIRQMETGFQYLKRELNITHLKTGWQLDPFGHSSLTAALIEKMGFETLVVSRVEENIRNYLEVTGNCEFLWKGEGFNTKTGVLTHVLNDQYYPPYFLDKEPWNWQCCFKELPASEEDVDLCVALMEEYVNSTQYKYRTNNHLMLMGGDFFYSNLTYSLMFFDLLDRIMKKSHNLDINYATPSDYFDEVYKEKQVFDTFSGDMLPLITSGNPYRKAWTGFYSNQPTLKKKIIEIQSQTRATEILHSLVMKSPFISYNLATTTHHDAITGTNRPKVYLDYMRMLKNDQDLILEALSSIYEKMLPKDSGSSAIISNYKVLYLFNSLDWKISRVMSIDSNYPHMKIFNSKGKALEVQAVPWDSGFRFYFKYDLEAYTLETLFISESLVSCSECSRLSSELTMPSLKNKHLEVQFKNGLIHTVKHSGNSYELNTQIMNYTTDQSGYYTFCPYLKANMTGELESFLIHSGKIVQIAESRFFAINETFTQRVVLEEDADELKVLFELKPPPNSDIFLRFNKRFTSGSWFYMFNTANIMKKYFKYDSSFRKGNNYYPVNGAFFVDLKTEFMFLIPSFPLSAGMVTEKSFEVNLNRYTTGDDGLGVGNYTFYGRTLQHEWLLGFHKPEYEFIWKKYLEHRNQPLALFDSGQKKLTDDIEEAEVFEKSWKRLTKKQVLHENECSHISSLASRGELYLATVLNVCQKPAEYPFHVVKKSNLAGLNEDKKRKNWKKGNEINFWIYNNTGQNVLKYPFKEKNNHISSFDLVSFYTTLDVVKSIKSEKATSKSNFSWVLIVLAIIVALGLVALGWYKLKKKYKGNKLTKIFETNKPTEMKPIS